MSIDIICLVSYGKYTFGEKWHKVLHNEEKGDEFVASINRLLVVFNKKKRSESLKFQNNKLNLYFLNSINGWFFVYSST